MIKGENKLYKSAVSVNEFDKFEILHKYYLEN